MVATVTIKRMTGSGPTYTTVTTVRLRTDDANTADTTNPIPIHPSGVGNFKYSYWASICLSLSGTYTQITNVRHYSDGTLWTTLGTGGVLNRGDHASGDDGCADGGYQQATGSVGDTGHEITATHADYSSVSDVASDTSGSPMVVDNTTTYSGTTYTKHVVMQLKVDGDATQGTLAAETMTWVYDEI